MWSHVRQFSLSLPCGTLCKCGTKLKVVSVSNIIEPLESTCFNPFVARLQLYRVPPSVTREKAFFQLLTVT